MDRQADVVAVVETCLSSMHADPHLDVAFERPAFLVKRPLGIDGCRDCVVCLCKGDEERIAFSRYLKSAVLPPNLAQDPVVPMKDAVPLGTESLDVPSGALDVGEEKRDRSGGR